MKINEVFKSVQGEGRFQGEPVVFVRTSGCTRKCSYCDTKYHTSSKEASPGRVAREIRSKAFGCKSVVFTGGEPLIYWSEIKQVINLLPGYSFHMETNGDLIDREKFNEMFYFLKYVGISPKEAKIAHRVYYARKQVYGRYKHTVDIKVVTDLKTLGKDMLKYASVVMPLTTYNRKQDQVIRQDVWNYCVTNNKFYSARLHVDIFGQTRGK